MHGKSAISAAESGDEVIFPGANGSFGSVATMDMRWYQLVVDVIDLIEFFKEVGCFIV